MELIDFPTMKKLTVISFYLLVFSAVSTRSENVSDIIEIEEQGLYSKADDVVILGHGNFEKKIYGQSHAWLLQFYNSYCGHCKAFSPKFKSLATKVTQWKNVIKLAVVDCSVEENNEICRQFEVMAYPSLRYLHERYAKGNSNIGEKFVVTENADKMKTEIVKSLQNEQLNGHLTQAPSLAINSYSSYATALADVPNNVIYTFLIFEAENSTIGSEVILDTNDYENIRVKRVLDTCKLANIAEVTHFPALVAVRSTLEPTPLTPKSPTRSTLVNAINMFLKSKNYAFPVHEVSPDVMNNKPTQVRQGFINSDIVYYSDLEKTLKTSLHTEISRYKILRDEPFNALLDYLDVLILAYPFKANGKDFIVNLRNNIQTKSEWPGSELYDLVKKLENSHAPVYVSDIDYVACKGSQAKYRGYTCGLWTLFHTLTVNAALTTENGGPKVLQAMHGYVKHFFGCTECSQHFQQMAARNRITEVKENDKAVLWLWISHNEVNLRIAGDVTEDPAHPKIQFPSVEKCRECRLSRGAWNLPAVYMYLQKVYGADNIREDRGDQFPVQSPSPFSNLDLGMLSLMYMSG